MYNVIVVDDELPIRDKLETVPWNDFGFNFSGALPNGLAACEYLADNPVDLILTDIRMPLMDGLELISHISKYYGQKIKVIILSGYDDFEYVRESLRYGAVDYLIKPLQHKDLSEALNRVKSDLDSEVNRDLKMEALAIENRQQLAVIRRKCMESLLKGVPDPLLLSECKKNNASATADGPGKLIIAGIDNFSQIKSSISDKNRKLITTAVELVLNEQWEESSLGRSLWNGNEGIIYLWLSDPGVITDSEELEKILKTLQESLYRYKGLFRSTISIIKGGLCKSVDEIALHIGKLKEVFYSKTCEDTIITAEIKTVLSDSACSNNSIKEEEDSGSSKNDGHIVERARDYLQDYFMHPLTLVEVAKYLKVNPCYLSHIFKEKTGKSFISYLTDYRLEKAKEMLRKERTIKVYTIGEQVGYDNPQYFSDIFKKNVGMTPRQYRMRRDELP